jgi:hypothetical protein
MTHARKRRWLRWSLLTLASVVTALACWMGFELNWIQQRHELLARHIPPTTSDVPQRVGVPPQPVFCTIPPTAKTAGYGLRLIGEPDNPEVRLYLGREEKSRHDELELAVQLFPEANIIVFLPTRTAIPWVGSLKAVMWPAAGSAPH